MAKRNKKEKIIYTIISIIAIIIIAVINQSKEIQSVIGQVENKNDINANIVMSEDGIKTIIIGDEEKKQSEENLEVYYIDVGQADSILIVNQNQSMLIDAGNNDDGQDVVQFIKERGISKLDYVIGTHPHEDHIGGLDDVINEIDIDKIYLPKIQTNTKTYESVLEAIQNKNKSINSLQKGNKITLGEAELEVMTDSILDKENLNLASNIIKLEFNGISFLFTGDAETENEKTINWENIDILKVGHHGSTTSSSSKFIKQIKPKYAIISVGKDNSYGHPHKEIIKRLEDIESEILRTDEFGTIKFMLTPLEYRQICKEKNGT